MKPGPIFRRIVLALAVAAAFPLLGGSRKSTPERPTGPASDTQAVLTALQTRSKRDRAAAASQIRRAAEAADPAERPLLTRIAWSLESLDGSGSDFQKSYPAVLSILRDLGTLYPEQFEVQVKLAATLSTVAEAAPDADREALRKEAMTRAQELVKRFPGEGRARGALARLLMEHGDDTLEPVRLLYKCATLDPSAFSCRDDYNRAARAFVQPGCGPEKLRRYLTFWRAVPRGSENDRVVEWNGSRLVLVEKLAAYIDFTGARTREDGVTLGLSPAAAGRLAGLAERPKGEVPWLVLMNKDELVTAARFNPGTHFDRGATLTLVPIENLCDPVEHRQIPGDLPPRM